MTFRKLRIAWSVVWGLAAVLLFVWWVRSYWWRSQIDIPLISNTCGVSIESVRGQLQIWHYSDPGPRWLVSGSSVLDWLGHPPVVNDQFDFPPRPGLATGDGTLWIPHWFLVVLSAALAVAPWLPRRFSLRTLLITTTLVAVVLGLIVWLR